MPLVGIYDGSRIKFYWTEGDKLWINTDGTTLVQSAKDEINSAMTALKDTKTPDAKFYFQVYIQLKAILYVIQVMVMRMVTRLQLSLNKVRQSLIMPDILVRMVTVVRLLLLERMESISLLSHTRRLT